MKETDFGTWGIAVSALKGECLVCGSDLGDALNRDDTTLFILRVEDMAAVYDHVYGEGSYDKLSDQEKTDLKLNVKKHLEYGLGEAWADYMKIAIENTPEVE